jgi:hypothetical protein
MNNNFCVSLTTIPSRLNTIEKTIDSLNKQTLKANKIFLNIPIEFKRFKNQFIDQNKIEKFRDKGIEITRCNDYGPGTKLLGSINNYHKYDCVIILDDDHIYHNKMFEIFMGEFKKNKTNYSYYIQKIFKLSLGQGADGILINTQNLGKLEKFYDVHVKNNKNLFLNDDLWISMYLEFIEKKPLLDLSNIFYEKTNKKLVYEIHTENDSLKKEMSKKFLNRRKIAKIEYFKFKIKNYFNNLNQ